MSITTKNDDNEYITEKGHEKTYYMDTCVVLKTVVMITSRCLLIINVDAFPPQWLTPSVLFYS